MHVGSELRRARFARGLSREQLSGITKISAERLDAIERNRVDELPPIVYLRGYLRAYAREVGLDPDDIAERYIAQFETPSVEALDEFADEPVPAVAVSGPAAAGAAQAATRREVPRRAEGVPAGAALRDEATRAVAADRRGRRRAFELVAGVIAVAAIVAMLMRSGDRFAAVAPAVDAGPALADAQRADGEPSGEAARADAAESPAPAAVAPSAVEPADAARAAATNADAVRGSSDRSADLAGDWTFTTQVQSSALRAFRGLQLGYRIELEQQGTRLTGRGVKVSENGQSLPRSRRTSISLSGTIEGDRVSLTFSEAGSRRQSGGAFDLRVADDGTLRGTFHSDAAQSSGRSMAFKDR